MLPSIFSSIADLMTVPNQWPWQRLLLNVFAFIQNYGWRVVLFTVLLNVAIAPLEIYSRFKMFKNQRIMKKIKPETEALQMKYGHDKRLLFQKTRELNKREGVSMFASCLPMLVTMGLFIWLIQSFNGVSQYMIMRQYLTMNDIFEAAHGHQRNQLEQRLDRFEEDGYRIGNYNASGDFVIARAHDNYIFSADGERVFVIRGFQDPTRPHSNDNRRIARYSNEAETYMNMSSPVRFAQEAVRDVYMGNIDEIDYGFRTAPLFDVRIYYVYGDSGFVEGENQYRTESLNLTRYLDHLGDEMRTGFLWVENVWSPDVPWREPILDHGQFLGSIGRYGDRETGWELSGFERQTDFDTVVLDEAHYNRVTHFLRGEHSALRGANGFLILPIFAIIFMGASQFLMMRQQKKSGQMDMAGMGGGGAAGGGGAMKMMQYIMPLMMGVFALFQSVVFTMYIITNSVMRMLINLATTGALTWWYKRKDAHLYADTDGDDDDLKSEKGYEKLEEGEMTRKERKEKRQSGDEGRVLKYGRQAPTEVVKKEEGEKKKKKFKL
ncbi:MAG: YidC/Oxa1 family membrane protein insertase [Firmicutes bacterium]|nr:YidC/Oxa1 family membrane protein insertase [Bacillota bacterium]